MTAPAPVAGVAGQPIGHSLSPLIHNLWLEATGVAARYEAFEPEDEGAFDALVGRIRSGELAGINVTAPYKERALALAAAASPTAAACGSVNLLTRLGGELYGDSTDGLGMMAALAEQAPELALDGRVAVVLGAGGAARAAVAVLVAAGAEVRIVNRTVERADRLASDLGGEVATWAEAAPGAALVVNAAAATPDVDLDRLARGAVVMDMTYRPLETPLLAASRRRGLAGVDGLAMLIGQARPSFAALFGLEAPDVDVRGPCLSVLGEPT